MNDEAGGCTFSHVSEACDLDGVVSPPCNLLLVLPWSAVCGPMTKPTDQLFPECGWRT